MRQNITASASGHSLLTMQKGSPMKTSCSSRGSGSCAELPHMEGWLCGSALNEKDAVSWEWTSGIGVASAAAWSMARSGAAARVNLRCPRSRWRY